MKNRINVNDIIGNKSGKLTVESYSHYDNNTHFYNCKCDCGGTKIAGRSSIKGGGVKSCGCASHPKRSANHKSKIQKQIPENIYDNDLWIKCKNTLNGMYNRCYNINNSGYKNYGGRGITVCEDWKNRSEDGFYNFYMWSISNGISKELSIDRIDVNGNYEPDNCRWANILEQNTNKRNSIVVAYKNKNITIAEASELSGISCNSLYYRAKQGLTGDELFKKKYTGKKVYKIDDLLNEIQTLNNKIDNLTDLFLKHATTQT